MALPQSKTKYLAIYAIAGLIVGLALGMGIVVVRTIVSDRLRRRDDVATAMGVPVKLSVPPVPLSRWRPGRRGLAAAQHPAVRRITEYLRAALPRPLKGTAALAVVPVDETQVAALSLVSLAVSCAQEGRSVVVADLVEGAPVAALLQDRGPGVRSVTVNGTQLTLAVPEGDDLAPAGPVGQVSADAQRSEFAAAGPGGLRLTRTCCSHWWPSIPRSAPNTWRAGPASAVAVVTAGRSSWAKVQAAGEMSRLAGLPMSSAVLVGADRADESLGETDRLHGRTSLADLG